MRFFRKNKIGITLIELLVVTAMLGVVSMALYAVLNNGLKIWQRINQPRTEDDLYIFFDKWTQDLRNCLRTSEVAFSADAINLQLPTLVNLAKTDTKAPGKIIYLYDQNSKTLSRLQSDFSQIYNAESSDAQKLNNITSLKFEYYSFDEQQKSYVWKEALLGGLLPLAVRVELTYDDKTGSHSFVKTVNIPIAR